MTERADHDDEIRALKERLARLSDQLADPRPNQERNREAFPRGQPERATVAHEGPYVVESHVPRGAMAVEGHSEGTYVSLRGRILQSPAARIIALFVFVGLGFGASTLAYLGSTGMFGEQDLSSLFAGALVLMASFVSVAIAATFLAVLCGAYIGTTHDGVGSAPMKAALATAGGHILLVLTFGIVLLIGFAVLMSPGASEEAGQGDAGVGDSDTSEDGSVGWSMLVDLALPVVGSGSSGALAAWFFSWRPSKPVAPAGERLAV